MNKLSTGRLAVILLTLFFSSLTLAEENNSSPQKGLVENLHTRLVEQMQSGETYEERASRLESLVASTFDTFTIARIALGSHWKNLEPEEQVQMQARIKALIISNYAGRFKKFTGESFSSLNEQPIGSNRYLVKTILLTGKNETVNLDYFLTESDGRWKIYDVTANGVSDLALKRASYSDIFKRLGFAGVLDEIDNQVDKNKPAR